MININTEDKFNHDNLYSSILLNNKSHDLSLVTKDLRSIYNWLEQFEVTFIGPYGTPVAETDIVSKNINNVTDAYKYTRRLDTITRPKYTDKKGTMTISLNRTIPLTLELN